ncbi:MAG: hypothetical protein ACK56I_14205, partial [bacterium]
LYPVRWWEVSDRDWEDRGNPVRHVRHRQIFDDSRRHLVEQLHQLQRRDRPAAVFCHRLYELHYGVVPAQRRAGLVRPGECRVLRGSPRPDRAAGLRGRDVLVPAGDD